ncbi:hypothetical protein [Pseudomonas sp. UMAB-08]|uniref:hypothetical protein n=1 Tax=Pseudomonas sp. UMAB-08 TaxID=1365375 RepID=UPI001C59FDFE|nr:hypothetical protein [Pseudomonas sp. UMAB-08]
MRRVDKVQIPVPLFGLRQQGLQLIVMEFFLSFDIGFGRNAVDLPVAYTQEFYVCTDLCVFNVSAP